MKKKLYILLLFMFLPLSLMADDFDFPTEVLVENNIESQGSYAIVTIFKLRHIISGYTEDCLRV